MKGYQIQKIIINNKAIIFTQENLTNINSNHMINQFTLWETIMKKDSIITETHTKNKITEIIMAKITKIVTITSLEGNTDTITTIQLLNLTQIILIIHLQIKTMQRMRQQNTTNRKTIIILFINHQEAIHIKILNMMNWIWHYNNKNIKYKAVEAIETIILQTVYIKISNQIMQQNLA